MIITVKVAVPSDLHDRRKNSPVSKASDKPQFAQMRSAVHAEIERGRDSKYWAGSADDSVFMGKFYDQERLLIDMHARFPEIREAVIAEAIGDRFAWFEMR